MPRPVADSLLGALAAVTAAFDDAGVPAVVVGGVTVRLPRVEDLMIMKAVAQRPQDMLDLEGLIAAHPQADLTVVRQWVREFSSAAAMPSLLEDFDRLARRMGR